MAVERKRKKGGKWGYRFSQAGTCYKRFAWATRAEAKEAEIQFRANLKNNPPLPPTALVNVASAYLIESAEKGRSSWRIDGLRSSIKKHVLGHFGEARLITDITPQDVERLLLKLKREGKKPKTVWHVMANLSSMLNYAISKKLLRDNPVRDADLSVIGSTKSVKPPMDMEQIAKAAGSIKNPVDRAWFDVTRFTGMRKDEANRLQWDDIDFERAMIHYPGTKTEDSNAWLPLAPVALRTLKELRKQSDPDKCPWVFPGRSYQRKGQKVYSRRYMFESLERATGIHLKPKDLRDYFASEVASRVTDPAVVMKLLRHTNMTTTTKYLRTVENRMRDAIENLGASDGGNFESKKVAKTAQNGIDEKVLALAKLLIGQGFYGQNDNGENNAPAESCRRHAAGDSAARYRTKRTLCCSATHTTE
jgi:integrase